MEDERNKKLYSAVLHILKNCLSLTPGHTATTTTENGISLGDPWLLHVGQKAGIKQIKIDPQP